MLKQLTVPALGSALGLAFIVAAAAPAAADRSNTRYVDPTPRYTYKVQPAPRGTARVQTQRKVNRNLDTETEAVWRNLRPNRFVD